MRLASVQSLLAFGLPCAWGCAAEPAPVFIDVSALEYDVVFVVVEDETGGLLRTSALHLRTDEGVSGSEALRISLESGERAFLLALEHEDLRRASAAHHPERSAELRLVLDEGASACPGGRLIDDDRRFLAPLPESVSCFEVDVDAARLEPFERTGSALLARARLTFPIPEAGCLDLPPRFQPFFSDPETITREIPVLGVRGLIRLDEDRLLMLTGPQLVLLDRGAEPPVRRLYTLPAPSGKAIKTRSPRPIGRGVPLPFFAVGQTQAPDGSETMFGYDLEFDGVDRVTMVRSTTIGPGNLMDLAFGPDGRVTLVGELAPVYTRGPDQDTFSAQPVVGSASLYSVRVEKDGRALLGAEAGSYFEGDPSVGQWRRRVVDHEAAIAIRLRAIARPYDDEELWVAGSRGALLRGRSGGTWTYVELAMPRDFRGCGRGEALACGGTRQYNSVDELMVVPRGVGRPPTVLMFLTHCAGVVVLDDDAFCPGVLGVEGVPILSQDGIKLQSVDLLGDRWLTLGDEGASTMIYELDLGAPR